MEWEEKEIFKLENIRHGELDISFNGFTFTVNCLTDVQKEVKNLLKLDAYSKDATVAMFEGDSSILFVTARRHGQKVILLVEQRSEDGKSDKIGHVQFNYQQLVTEVNDVFKNKEIAESYKLNFESFRL